MALQKKQEESRVNRQDSFWASLAARRRERIRRTMLRPLYQEALKSLFLTGALLGDALFSLEVFVSLPFPVSAITALVLVCILLYIELRIWNAVWGRGGRWGLDKYSAESK